MRRRTLVIGAVVLAGAALVLFCCAGSDRQAEPGSTSSSGSNPPVEPPLAAAGAAASARPEASVAPGSAGARATFSSEATAAAAGAASADASPGTPPPGPGARIAQVLKGSDPRDLELLASAERELKTDPPPELRSLITQRKNGASRDELTRAIQALPDLRLRVLAVRWLEQVAPAKGAGAP